MMELPYMEWHVTKEKIIQGVRKAPECCPVSLAGIGTLVGLKLAGMDVQVTPHVDSPFITIYTEDGDNCREYECSVHLGNWIERFDSEGEVQPITVVLSEDNGAYVAYVKGEAVLSVGKDIL